jgi:exopolysaccharide production protein ExoQ
MNTFSPAAPRGAAPGAPIGSLADRRPRSLLRYARLTDPTVMFGWVFFTTVPMDWAAPLRYLCVAYFVAGMVLFARDTLPTYVRAWPTLLLPVLCVISAIWAPSANEAFRKALLMGLTGTVAVYAASRLSIRQIVSIYFLGEIFGAVLSAMSPNIANGAWTGVFGQKNFLAVHMFILYTTGLVILLDKGSNMWLRGSTLLFIPLAAGLIFLSKSATTILLLGGTTMAFLGHAFIWEPAARVKHMRTFIVAAIILLGLVAGLMLFGLFQFDVMDTILRSFGKDSTLTGRTFIWDWGHRIMNEHPWTGVGASGFWRPEVGVANQILTFFFYEQFVKFSFHNSYLENGVQLGYPGYYATVLLAAWGVWNAVRTWMKNQTLLNGAFLIFAVMVIIRSNAEIDLALELGATAVLFFIGAARKEDLRKPAPPPRSYPLTAQYQGGWRSVR